MPRCPSGKVSSSRPEGPRFETDSTEEPSSLKGKSILVRVTLFSFSQSAPLLFPPTLISSDSGAKATKKVTQSEKGNIGMSPVYLPDDGARVLLWD
ncbi:hypothetical protein AVEN_205741-1 [Araneus ventricosus]|uniref:Uncharacterized protein n=1 Tax=Araneus ventricosus TaxID=182803 RepID=A0A4Y2PCB5_ARAVE|nr:hypothetical protein AVEN_205741-1 [Araneus ventricosus]